MAMRQHHKVVFFQDPGQNSDNINPQTDYFVIPLSLNTIKFMLFSQNDDHMSQFFPHMTASAQ